MGGYAAVARGSAVFRQTSLRSQTRPLSAGSVLAVCQFKPASVGGQGWHHTKIKHVIRSSKISQPIAACQAGCSTSHCPSGHAAARPYWPPKWINPKRSRPRASSPQLAEAKTPTMWQAPSAPTHLGWQRRAPSTSHERKMQANAEHQKDYPQLASLANRVCIANKTGVNGPIMIPASKYPNNGWQADAAGNHTATKATTNAIAILTSNVTRASALRTFLSSQIWLDQTHDHSRTQV